MNICQLSFVLIFGRIFDHAL